MKNFTDEENYLIAVAYKKISEDPVVGCDQSVDVLWRRIGAEYKSLCQKHFKDVSELEVLKQAMDWKDTSLKNRFDRFIKPSVPNYNKAVKDTQVRSGESDDDHLERVLIRYLEITKQPFNPEKKKKHLKPVTYLPRVAEVLNQMPQFGGDHGNKDHNNRNVNGSVYSAVDTPRPEGNKFAKRQAIVKEESSRKKEKTEEAKVAAFEGMKEMIGNVATATASIAESMKEGVQVKHADLRIKKRDQLLQQNAQLMQLISMLKEFGRNDEAIAMLDQVTNSHFETKQQIESTQLMGPPPAVNSPETTPGPPSPVIHESEPTIDLETMFMEREARLNGMDKIVELEEEEDDDDEDNEEQNDDDEDEEEPKEEEEEEKDNEEEVEEISRPMSFIPTFIPTKGNEEPSQLEGPSQVQEININNETQGTQASSQSFDLVKKFLEAQEEAKALANTTNLDDSDTDSDSDTSALVVATKKKNYSCGKLGTRDTRTTKRGKENALPVQLTADTQSLTSQKLCSVNRSTRGVTRGAIRKSKKEFYL